MSVKEVQNVNAQQVLSETKAGRVLTIQGLKTAKVESDQVDISSDGSLRPSQIQQKVRTGINEAIDATNLAANTVDDIDKLVSGIAGIAEQANSTELSPQRVSILEKEANQLREEISKVAARSTPQGVKPLLGDKISVRIEETLGKTLEVILPDDAKSAFGIGDIQLSKKELIVNTVVSVERARQAIEDLRIKLSEGVDNIRATVLALDVANQNTEASKSSIRDVDQALSLASDTKGEIREDPRNALASVGDIGKQGPELLK